MMNPDFRALCAELMNEAIYLGSLPYEQDPDPDLIVRVRALLAQPEPVAVVPTESDVTELFYRHMGEGSEVGFENAIAEALDRWGTPANTLEQPNDHQQRRLSR